MSPEVVDTNVLTIASAPGAAWVHPRIPLAELALVDKVFRWVREFRENPERSLVLDLGESILDEYRGRGNMPDFLLYGRQVVQHKIQTGAVHWVELEYWNNGTEKVARLPEEVEQLVHDVGDRKMIAAAAEAGAPIVNACDSDWSSDKEQRALLLMGVTVHEILTDTERKHCRER